jgi:hypothetical protein
VLDAGRPIAGATWAAPRQAIALVHVGARLKADVVHELLHVELHHRVPPGALPAWFHEGLAVWVSENFNCGTQPHRGIDDLSRLATNTAWREYTDYRNTQQPTYCQARGAIADWVKQHGKDALWELIAAAGKGAPFAERWGPLPARRTQVQMSTLQLADTFSLELTVKPKSLSGVLVHLSDNPVGSGWCNPVLGFDADHHLVAQLAVGDEKFAVARAKELLPVGAPSRVGMTWSKGVLSLLVNGKSVAKADAPKLLEPDRGTLLYATWGSYNLGGVEACWLGALTPDNFDGEVSGTRVSD